MLKSIYIASALSVLFSCTLAAQTHADSLMAELSNPASDKVFVVSHRCDWRNAPENSLQAAENCINMGVDMIEIDLKMTKDSVLILMHDKTIDRTTTGKGKPIDYTLSELKSMHLRNGAGHKTAHQIPTFEELMILCKGRILVNVDKGYDYFRQVYAILEKTGTEDQCIIKSNLPYAQVQAENGDVLKKIPFMPVIDLDKPEAYNHINDYQKRYRPIAYELVFIEDSPQTCALIDFAQDCGSKVFINSLWPELCGGHDDDRAVERNQPDQAWGWLIEKGAKLLQTDRPECLIEYIQKNYNQ